MVVVTGLGGLVKVSTQAECRFSDEDKEPRAKNVWYGVPSLIQWKGFACLWYTKMDPVLVARFQTDHAGDFGIHAHAGFTGEMAISCRVGILFYLFFFILSLAIVYSFWRLFKGQMWICSIYFSIKLRKEYLFILICAELRIIIIMSYFSNVYIIHKSNFLESKTKQKWWYNNNWFNNVSYLQKCWLSSCYCFCCCFPSLKQ